MGEFVGIDPLGADKLIRQMEAGKDVLARARPGLEAAIAEAGEQWAGREGVAAMHRTWAFFHESQQDLKWRIYTIKRLVPTNQKGMLTSTFPFSNETAAAQAAKKDAAAIAEALKYHDQFLSGQSWSTVEKALAALKGRVDDPSYAAALLTALGPATFQKLFRDWMNTQAAGARRGLTPDALTRADDSSPGLLARAFASAEGFGRLGNDWQKMVETAPSDILTALVAQAPQSGTFLNRVATNLLNRPPNSDTFPTDPNWNLYNLAKAYEANPEAFRRLLVEHQKEAGVMLDAYTIRSSGVPEYEEALAKALHGALKPGAGADDLRERAWITVINSIGSEHTLWVGGGIGTFANSPISRVLAQDITPILDKLARGQAERNSPEVPYLESRAPWDKLDPTVSARFLGALMQDSAAADTLMKAGQNYTKELDMGRFHPLDPDLYAREAHLNLAARTGALSNLLLAGSTYAEWSDDEYAERIAGYVLMPVDFVNNKYLPIDSAVVSTGKDKGLDDVKGVMKEMITNYLDKKTPEDAEAVADKLVEQQANFLVDSLKAHGQMPLAAGDRALMRDAIKGRLFSALVQALQRRGG
ncbi:hypothetical protein [Nonomuraea cavernae]|uniref:Uncharacterized protein n=1 Tax=Nonomuraea cavernae TaxID=2045107 RepID=A0A917ZIB4_9ACTN|nr:hypothetical protein [Nonomuraea cavernae]MCA2190977.1 hypothetical protein [Nonomuraea cavernae]GGO83635.1 hypothetical protein GCM10012289_77520 [Nonomuraea cavernae]